MWFRLRLLVRFGQLCHLTQFSPGRMRDFKIPSNPDFWLLSGLGKGGRGAFLKRLRVAFWTNVRLQCCFGEREAVFGPQARASSSSILSAAIEVSQIAGKCLRLLRFTPRELRNLLEAWLDNRHASINDPQGNLEDGVNGGYCHLVGKIGFTQTSRCNGS